METPLARLYFNYQIFKEERLIIEAFKGTMTLDFMKKFKSNEAEDKNFNHEINVLSDIRELNFDGTTQEVEEYKNFTQEHGQILGKRRTAIIYNTPNQHAYAYIYEKLCQGSSIEIRLFKEIDKALHWLESNTDPVTIEIQLKQLKQNAFSVK